MRWHDNEKTTAEYDSLTSGIYEEIFPNASFCDIIIYNDFYRKKRIGVTNDA